MKKVDTETNMNGFVEGYYRDSSSGIIWGDCVELLSYHEPFPLQVPNMKSYKVELVSFVFLFCVFWE